MAVENWKKIKLLKLAELLVRETDEQHPLPTAQICEKMEKMGIPCERRAVGKDIALLNELGIEVLSTWVGRSKAFYVEDRPFSVPELKILIDAVQAAGFITARKTEELIGKIADLGGAPRSRSLRNGMVCFNVRKHVNESIYYNVDALETALQDQKKVLFRYFDLGPDKERIYRRDGHHYVVEPVALIYHEDNYYAVAYSDRYDDSCTYRIDRMDDVEVLEEPVSEKALEMRGSVSRYTQETVKMYGGPLEEVTLEFDRSLIGPVYDRFGETTDMVSSGEDRVQATVPVQLSPAFWGWIFQFGKGMKILSPESVKEERRKRIADLMES